MLAGRGSSLEPLAASVQRLGVMMAAGVAPNSAWVYLAEEAPPEVADAVRHVSTEIGAGRSVGDALAEVAASSLLRDRTSWRALAAAWLVASEAGAPLASTLAEFASTMRGLAHTERELRTALAAPSATARLVMVLPVVGILFGLALGFNVFVILFTTVPGFVCVVLGLVLMLAARMWTVRLVRGATPKDSTPGLSFDLMAIAVSGGSTTERAREIVAVVAERCELTASVDTDAVEGVLRLSRRAGVPAGVLLRSEAAESRRRAEAEAKRKTETLSVALMLPLGLCVLPAFMVLGVAPLVIAVVVQSLAPL